MKTGRCRSLASDSLDDSIVNGRRLSSSGVRQMAAHERTSGVELIQDRVPSRQLRLKITTQIPSPYQVELFDALADRDDVSVKVLYWKGTVRHMFDAPSSTRHPSRVLKGVSVPFPFSCGCREDGTRPQAVD